MTQITDFGLLGNEFQIKLISQIITDRSFGLNIVSTLQPKYFENIYCRHVVSIIKNYNSKYDNQIPTLTGLKELILAEVTDDIQKKSCIEIVKELLKKSVLDPESTQELALKFCKQQELIKAVSDAQKIIKKGDVDGTKIEEIFRKAISATDKTDTTMDVDQDIDSALEEDYRNPVPTGIDGLDLEIGGGLGKGELGMLIMPTGTGKSTMLSKIGNTAYKLGYNVLQVFFEDKPKDIQRKHCTALTNVPLNDLYKHKERVKDALEVVKSAGGNLILRKYPSDATTVAHIKTQLRQLKSKGIVIDMLIVDYVDCLTNGKYGDDANAGEGDVVRQLEALCSEFDVILWTAVQSNRSGAGADVVDINMIQGSFKRAQVGHLIISVAKTAEQKERGLATMAILKSRFGGDGKIFKDMIFQNDTLVFDTTESNLISQVAFDDDRKMTLEKEKQDNALKALKEYQILKQKAKDSAIKPSIEFSKVVEVVPAQ